MYLLKLGTPYQEFLAIPYLYHGLLQFGYNMKSSTSCYPPGEDLGIKCHFLRMDQSTSLEVTSKSLYLEQAGHLLSKDEGVAAHSKMYLKVCFQGSFENCHKREVMALLQDHVHTVNNREMHV